MDYDNLQEDNPDASAESIARWETELNIARGLIRKLARDPDHWLHAAMTTNSLAMCHQMAMDDELFEFAEVPNWIRPPDWDCMDGAFEHVWLHLNGVFILAGV